LFVYSWGLVHGKNGRLGDEETVGAVRFLWKNSGFQLVGERVGVLLGVLDAGN
jgi:hypothetical protein